MIAYRAKDLETASKHLTRALDCPASVARERSGASDVFGRARFRLQQPRGPRAAAGSPQRIDRERGSWSRAHRRGARGVSKNKLWREVRRSLQNDRAMAELDLGNWTEAVASADLIDDDGSEKWFSCRAQVLERASRIAAVDEELDAAQQAATKLRERALTELAEAVRLGRTDWSELPDPDEWTSLRGDPRFGALVEKSQAPR